MKVAVVGSRDESLCEFAKAFVRELPGDTVVISGGAFGVDTAAKNEALDRGLEYIDYPADWTLYKRRAGAIRNAAMVRDADFVVAFWNGSPKSRGTKMTMTMAEKSGKLRPPVVALLVEDRVPCAACRDRGWVSRGEPGRDLHWSPCVACAFAGRYPDYNAART